MQNTIKNQWYDGYLYGWFFDPVEGAKRQIISDFIPEKSTVLDVCCGTGRLSFELAEKCESVTGVDQSLRMLNFCNMQRARQTTTNVDFVFADAAKLESVVDQKFDYAVISLGLHEMEFEKRIDVLRSMVSVAKNLVISDFCAPQPKNIHGFLNIAMERIIGGRENFALFNQYIATGGIKGVLEQCGLELLQERVDKTGTRHVIMTPTG